MGKIVLSEKKKSSRQTFFFVFWRFWALFGGCRGKLWESRENCWIIFPNREMLQFLGFRALGKANLPGTLARHCLDLAPTFRAGCFLQSTVPAFSSFSELRVQSRSSTRLRIAASIAFLFRACLQGALDTIAPLMEWPDRSKFGLQ